MSQDPAPPNLAQLLAVPFQAIVAELHARLAAAGYGDIRPHHGPVFGYLPAEGARLTELAERAQTTKQAMGQLVDALERGGYVERIPDPLDRRAKQIRLTSRGWAVHERGGEVVAELQTAWANALGPGKLAQLVALLDELRTHLAARAAAQP